MKKKAENQKLKKTDLQNITTEKDIIEVAYDEFLKVYGSPPPPSSAMDNPFAVAAKEGKDIEFFQKFFKNNEKLPEYIKPKDLRNFLDKRPGIFCRFLEYPTFLDMILGVSPDCEDDEKDKGYAFINGLKIRMEKSINKINKEMEERSKLAKRNAEINKIKEEKRKGYAEISKIEAEIEKGSKDFTKGNEEIRKIRTELLKRDAELDKIEEPDKRDKKEKENWENLQKAFDIYINPRKIYLDLLRCVSNETIDTSALQTLCMKLIGSMLARDPLPAFIEQEDLLTMILRAPITMSVFFQYPNFVKRLKGYSFPDNVKVEDNEKLWDKFFDSFTLKLNIATSHHHINNEVPAREEVTQSRFKEILNSITQTLKLLDEQAAEKIYDKNCQDFAQAIDVSFAATKNFMQAHPNPLGSEFIEKEMPFCLTTKLLKKLVTFAPEYAIKYMDNYYFMARLLADEIKKGNTLMADDLFEDLQNKFALVNFSHKDKFRLLLKHWEIRLRLHLGITLLIREIVKLIGLAVSGKDFKEGKSEEDMLNLTDKKVLSTVTKKLNELLIDVSSSTEYEWIDELKAFVTKLSKSLSNVSLLTNKDGMPVYKEIRNIIDEINSYLSNENLLKEIKTRAQSLRQENISNVVTIVDESSSSANTFSH